jgi:hypothetical protein
VWQFVQEQFLPVAKKNPPISLLPFSDLHIIETPHEPLVCSWPETSEDSAPPHPLRHMLHQLELVSPSFRWRLSAGLHGRGLSGQGVRVPYCNLWSCPWVHSLVFPCLYTSFENYCQIENTTCLLASKRRSVSRFQSSNVSSALLLGVPWLYLGMWLIWPCPHSLHM